jgi:hypothetical protein
VSAVAERVMRHAGQSPGHHDIALGADDDPQVHPVLTMLAGEGPVRSDPADGD